MLLPICTISCLPVARRTTLLCNLEHRYYYLIVLLDHWLLIHCFYSYYLQIVALADITQWALLFIEECTDSMYCVCKSMNEDVGLHFMEPQKPRAFRKYSQQIHGAQYLLRPPTLSLPLRRQPASERDGVTQARRPERDSRFIHNRVRHPVRGWSITSSPSRAQSPLECEQVPPDARACTGASIGSS